MQMESVQRWDQVCTVQNNGLGLGRRQQLDTNQAKGNFVVCGNDKMVRAMCQMMGRPVGHIELINLTPIKLPVEQFSAKQRT